MKTKNPLFTVAQLWAALYLCSNPIQADEVINPEPGPLDYQFGSWMQSSLTFDDFFFPYWDRATYSNVDLNLSLTADFAQNQFHSNLSSGESGLGIFPTGSATFGDFTRLQGGIFDTLTFDFGAESSGLVEFAFDVEGSISNLGSMGYGYGGSFVYVADVTGLTDPFAVNGFFYTGGLFDDQGLTTLSANSGSPDTTSDKYFANPTPLATGSAGFGVGDQTWIDDTNNAVSVYAAQGGDWDARADTAGNTFDFSKTIMSSFLAEEGHTYALWTHNTAATYMTDATNVDMLGTTALRFTNLSGGSYQSGSGVFLSQSSPIAGVPDENATLILALLGIPVLLFIKRRVTNTDLR